MKRTFCLLFLLLPSLCFSQKVQNQFFGVGFGSSQKTLVLALQGAHILDTDSNQVVADSVVFDGQTFNRLRASYFEDSLYSVSFSKRVSSVTEAVGVYQAVLLDLKKCHKMKRESRNSTVMSYFDAENGVDLSMNMESTNGSDAYCVELNFWNMYYLALWYDRLMGH